MTGTHEAPRTSLIATMARKYSMDPKAFENTVRSTVMQVQHTNEQFAALMMVANIYDLNPLTKEIYAYPAKGGGIVPIVSIDGWVNLVNSHPACDGFDFDFEHGEGGKLISCTCRMYRKDRSRPVVVTEYLSECKRNTDPWKMEHRMLRHKALIQAARYAFGFAGIYDPDEGEKIAEMRDVTPPKPPSPPPPPAPSSPKAKTPEPPTIDHVADSIDADKPEDDDRGGVPDHFDMDTGEIINASTMSDGFDATAFLEGLEAKLMAADTDDDFQEAWDNADALATFDGDDSNIAICLAIKARVLKERKGKKK